MAEEETAQTRARIVAVAARLFREEGIAATGVADVMKAAGLTHGVFYRHFASKDVLSAESISHAVCQSLQELEKAENSDARRQALSRYIARYLSDDHVEHPGRGCPLAALGSETRHAPAEAARQLGEGTERAMAALATAMDGRGEQASALMAMLVGTVMLARMAQTHQQRDQILSAGNTAAANYLNADVV